MIQTSFLCKTLGLNFLKMQLKLLLMYLISYFKTHEPSLLQLSAFSQYSTHSQRIVQFIYQITKKYCKNNPSNFKYSKIQFFLYPPKAFCENDFLTYHWLEYFLWLTRTPAQSQSLAVENLSDILSRGLVLMVCRAQTVHCHLKPKPWKPALSMA